MTNPQATAAFAAHAAAFPATHATLSAPVAPGVAAPPGYASAHGITAPIPAAVIVPLPPPAAAPVPAPVPPAAPLPVIPPAIAPAPAAVAVVPAPVAPVGPHTPSTPATTAQYKLLTEMVKINPQLVWSDENDPHQFLNGLESILEFSPVLHTHWTSLIIMMIPGKFELERTWVRNNIMMPLLSWNAAKTAFIGHFQRGDYLDGRRLLYTQCTQSPQETTQEYARRFQTLATQLGYADNDNQSIYRFIDGLHRDIQQKMLSHKLTMRTVGGIPGWDFMSLISTVQLAITIGAEPIYIQRSLTTDTLPLHLRRSALANPISNSTTSSSVSTTPSPTFTASTRKRKDTATEATQEKKCQYHPHSKTHSTEECRKKGNISSERSPPPSKPSSTTLSSSSSAPLTRAEKQQQQQQQSPTSSSPLDLSKIQCYRCNRMGHFANTCLQGTSSPSSTSNQGTKARVFNYRKSTDSTTQHSN